MKYFVIFFVVALAVVVSSQQLPIAAPPPGHEEGIENPAEIAEPTVEETARDKRGIGFGVYAYPSPYYYGGYKSYYRSPVSYYPYSYGFRKYYYY